MKKLRLKSPLNHKSAGYNLHKVEVEKVVTLYGNEFEEMKSKPYENNPYISANKELMFIDSNETAHCVLFVDNKSGDGLLVEAEGYNYARYSQFIPNARELIQQNEMTESEIHLHNELKKLSEIVAGYAHGGRKGYCFDELSYHVDFNELVFRTLAEMLEQREDIKQAEVTENISEIRIEPEEIYPENAVGCADEINEFIRNYSEPKEEHRGLMVYYDENPSVSEKVFSAIPSVMEINGRLMGVFECQITETLTDIELEEVRNYLIEQCSDGFFEGMEQHEIKTAEHGNIYVSFWNRGDDWSLQTEEEFMNRAEEIQPDMTM